MDSLPEEIISSIENKVGFIKLNRPKSLNALSENMIHILYKTLAAWKNDPEIALIVIEGEGEKAFCAGGDMRALYDLRYNGVEDYAEKFFAEEYRMNIMMHRYPKPIVVYMNGYVMGGGIGISTACSHRVVNEKTKWAMPEMNIGFYPDVGGSYFMSRMKKSIGRYLALSSATITGEDVIYLDEADYYISSTSWPQLKDSIAGFSWSEAEASSQLDSLIKRFTVQMEKEAALKEHENIIAEAFGHPAMEEIMAVLEQHRDNGNSWAAKTYDTLSTKSPISQKVTLEQLIRGQDMNLDDCFEMEMNLSLSFMSSDDFYEGTRSVLVDKDRNPKWNPDSYEKVSRKTVESFFSYQWKNGKSPLF